MSVDNPRAAENHAPMRHIGAEQRARSGAAQPLEAVPADRRAEIAKRTLALFPERKGGEHLGATRRGAQTHRVEGEGRDSASEAGLLDAGTRVLARSGQRVGERDRVQPVVEEGERLRSQQRGGQAELAREAVTDEPVIVRGEQAPRHAVVSGLDSEHRTA